MSDPTWKATTHDCRPPVQGGDPIFDPADLPAVLPAVTVDTSDVRCGEGWNSCADPADALRIAGVWPDGRPSRLWQVEPGGTTVTRGDKTRSEGVTVVREATDVELREAWDRLHAPLAVHWSQVAGAAWSWREALARPEHDPAAVEAGLSAALAARGLGWSLRRYDTARDVRAAWDARDAWAAWDARDAWAAWAAWDVRAVRDAWDVRAAWDARDAWAAWDVRAARDVRAVRAAWDVRAARDVRAVRDALTVQVAAHAGWTDHDPDMLTTGIRDAYRNGLAVAVPVEEGVLGWAMD